jgi:hypothetical protein
MAEGAKRCPYCDAPVKLLNTQEAELAAARKLLEEAMTAVEVAAQQMMSTELRRKNAQLLKDITAYLHPEGNQ